MHSEKNLTILNIGNTHVHVFDSLPDGSIVRRIVLATPDFMKTTAIWIENPRQTIAASVVPAVTEILRSSGVFVVSPKMTFPFSVRKLDLSTVGADRLANAAQLTDGKLPAVCIDFGTAVTFEVVTEDREFAGGAIMPGRMLLRRSLNDYTAQLPLIGITDLIPAVPGSNTVDAMLIGTDLAAVGAVREILVSLEKLFPAGTLRRVACGGDRHFFMEHLALEDGNLGVQSLMRVKACGIKTERDLETAVKAGVDAVGFLVGQVHTSHDFILASTAARLVKFLPPYVVPVIVTHLTAPDAILDIVEQTSILTIQLHGGSTAEEVAALRDNLGPAGKLIYAAHVLGMQVTPALEPYYDLVDAVLLDSMDRETGKVGGTGMTHNWDVSAAAAAASPVPLTLAGGLTPDNVAGAIRHVRPFAVDANSALKGFDGSLDLNLCTAFVRNAKNAN